MQAVHHLYSVAGPIVKYFVRRKRNNREISNMTITGQRYSQALTIYLLSIFSAVALERMSICQATTIRPSSPFHPPQTAFVIPLQNLNSPGDTIYLPCFLVNYLFK